MSEPINNAAATADEEVIKRLEARLDHTEAKVDSAAEVALGAVETIKHFQSAAEYAHAKEGEQLAAMRKMVNMVETLSRHVFAALPTPTPTPKTTTAKTK